MERKEGRILREGRKEGRKKDIEGTKDAEVRKEGRILKEGY